MHRYLHARVDMLSVKQNNAYIIYRSNSNCCNFKYTGTNYPAVFFCLMFTVLCCTLLSVEYCAVLNTRHDILKTESTKNRILRKGQRLGEGSPKMYIVLVPVVL